MATGTSTRYVPIELFGPDFGHWDVVVVDFFDEVMGVRGNELAGGVLEAIAPGPREHILVANAGEIEADDGHRFPGEFIIVVVGELAVEKEFEEPV